MPCAICETLTNLPQTPVRVPLCPPHEIEVEQQIQRARRRVGARIRKQRARQRDRLFGTALRLRGVKVEARRPKGVLDQAAMLEAAEQLVQQQVRAVIIPEARLHNGKAPPAKKAGAHAAAPEIRYCTDPRCNDGGDPRPLNLGRHKTQGDTCGTCKRRAKREARDEEIRREQASRIAAELEDDSALPDDGDVEGWKRLGFEADEDRPKARKRERKAHARPTRGARNVG